MKISFDCSSSEKLADIVKEWIKESADIINTNTICRKNFDEYIDKKRKKHYTVDVFYEYKK